MKPKRVLIARPAERARSLVRRLAEKDIECVVEPLLKVCLMTPAPAIEAKDLQAVLLTSAHAAHALAKTPVPRTLPVLAVGEATAAAARQAGFLDVRTGAGHAGDLVRLAVSSLDPRKGALLYARAQHVARDLRSPLQAARFAVRESVLYRTLAADRLSPAVLDGLARGELAAAAFFSPRGAASFVSLVVDAGLADKMDALAAVALSEAVAAPLRGLPWRRIIVAAAADEARVANALEHVLS